MKKDEKINLNISIDELVTSILFSTLFVVGIIWLVLSIKKDIIQPQKDKQFIYDNSNEYTVFNKCEKIYDRYYCKND